jgi:hypothetical protein
VHDKLEKFVVVGRQEGTVHEDLDDAEEETHAPGLVIAVLVLFLGLLFNFHGFFLALLRQVGCWLGCQSHELINISADKDLIQVLETTQFEELHAPFRAFLNLILAHFDLVHANLGVEDIQRVEHFVGA